MEVSASISYTINPEASTSVCGSSSQDANACFEVYGITKGNIAVYAFWQSRKLSCKWSKCKKVILTVIINSKIIFLFSLSPIHSWYTYRFVGVKRRKFVNYHILGA